jgi:DUF971 family protein
MADGGQTRFQGANLDLDKKELTVQWGDGHRSVYPLAYLRKHCPCAGCRQQREQSQAGGLLVLSSAALHAGDAIESIAPVGRYGLQPNWADGHNTGIFTFDYLRGLCPCPECRAQQQEDRD